MVGFLARSVIAIVVGTLFLLAMLLALGADLLDSYGEKRRTAKTLAAPTHSLWNLRKLGVVHFPNANTVAAAGNATPVAADGYAGRRSFRGSLPLLARSQAVSMKEMQT